MSFNPLGGEVNTANLPFEPPVLTPGQVCHVVAAYDSVGNKMNLYLDGVLVATNNMAGSDLTLIQADQGLIGASLFGDPDVPVRSTNSGCGAARCLRRKSPQLTLPGRHRLLTSM